MSRRVPLLISLGAAGALLAAAAPAAQSATICVNRTGAECTVAQPATGTLGAQLDAAIKAAAATTANDTILLGDGVYDNRATFYFVWPAANVKTGTLTIQGTGASKVTLADTGTTADDETLEGDQSAGALTVKDLTVEGPGSAPASLGLEIGAAGSALSNVRVVAPAGAAPGTLLAGVSVRRDITITGSTIEGFATGIREQTDANPGKLTGGAWTISRSTVSATGTAIAMSRGGGTLRRITATTSGAGSVALAAAGTTTVENSVIDAPNPAPGAANQALTAACLSTQGARPATDAEVSLRYVTVRSAAPAGVNADCATPGLTATLSLTDSILAPGTRISGTGEYTVGEEVVTGGSIKLTRSRWDGTGSSQGAIDFEGTNPTAAPGFKSSTDLHLAPGSPMIDQGVVSGSAAGEPYSGGDRDGAARITDGDGSGAAFPDLGAYEAPAPGTGTTTPPVTTPAPTTPAPTTPAPTTPLVTTPAPSTPATTAPVTSPPVTTPAPTTPPTTPPVTDPAPTTPPVAPPPVQDPPSIPQVPNQNLTTTVLLPYPGLTLKAAKVRIDRKRRVLVTVACPSAAVVTSCSGKVELQRPTGTGKRRRFVTIGKAALAPLAAGKSRTLRLTLTRSAAAGLPKAGRKLTLRATTADARAETGPVVRTVSITVRPAPR